MKYLVGRLGYAWAAGIVDGEGYIGLTTHAGRHKRRYLRMVIAQSSTDGTPEMLLKCKALLGGAIHGPYFPARNNKKPKYELHFGSKAARLAIQKIWPWLGTVKQQQALAVGFSLT
jgi:hypothetical protein